MDELLELSAVDLTHAIVAQQISSVELVIVSADSITRTVFLRTGTALNNRACGFRGSTEIVPIKPQK